MPPSVTSFVRAAASTTLVAGMADRRRWMVVVAALLAVTACNQSSVDPNAEVTVSGQVVGPDGAPVPGARVALMKELDFGTGFTAVMTIGLSCLDEREGDLSECGETRVGTTGDDGRFDYELRGRDTQGNFGNAAVMELATAMDRADDQLSGPAVNTRFQVQTDAVSIPLRFWSPSVDVFAEGGSVRADWTPPSGDVFPPAADLSRLRQWVVFSRSSELVWRADAVSDDVAFDLRLLEDSRGAVAAWSEVGDIKTDPASGTDVEVLLRSAGLPYASPAGAPVSRGKPCSVPAADGTAVTQGGCRLTDGRFAEELNARTCPPSDDTCTEPTPTEATVDLGAPVDLSLVVVRGCAGACTVEASEDGGRWRTLGAADESDGRRDHAFAASGRGRFVRVRADFANELREVSVWDPRPVAATGTLLVPPSEVEEARLPGGSDGGRSLLVVALAVLAGAVAVAALLVLRRRRGTADPTPS